MYCACHKNIYTGHVLVYYNRLYENNQIFLIRYPFEIFWDPLKRSLTKLQFSYRNPILDLLFFSSKITWKLWHCIVPSPTC